MEGKTERGASSPANPAFMMLLPLSNTIAETSPSPEKMLPKEVDLVYLSETLALADGPLMPDLRSAGSVLASPAAAAAAAADPPGASSSSREARLAVLDLGAHVPGAPTFGEKEGMRQTARGKGH